MLRGEFDARVSGSADRSAGDYFEQSAETHATADKKHRGGRAEIGREYDRRCCADVLPRFLHSAEPQKRQSVVGAQDQESDAGGPPFVMPIASPKRLTASWVLPTSFALSDTRHGWFGSGAQPVDFASAPLEFFRRHIAVPFQPFLRAESLESRKELGVNVLPTLGNLGGGWRRDGSVRLR